MKTILEIQGGKKNPYLKLTENELIITGRSYPELAVGFYKPVLDELNEITFFEDFSVRIDLEYLNTASSKSILYILKNITKKTKNNIKLVWVVEKNDDTMVDLYEYFKNLVDKVDFELEIKEEI
jgi:hypothetical protein